MDVDQSLVGADLEVLARVLVLERRTDHAVDVLFGGQRNWTGDRGPGSLGRLDDLAGSAIYGVVVIRLQPDSDLLRRYGRHGLFALFLLVSLVREGAAPYRWWGAAPVVCLAVFLPPFGSERAGPGPALCGYSTISATTPEPTVRPPSRIANRRPWSMAIGWISSIDISTLSPGITISVPSGRLATPVTSVVRK
jgi:hypothetical protein